MYQQTSSQPPQPPSGGSRPRPVPCYNCGALEHLVMACPEPTRAVPAGLAAARAAQAAQHLERPDSSRPYKRQKTGPVVTRFPAPATGPVVTHYALPQTQESQYGANQNFYGSASMQTHHRYPQSHPYAQGLPQQPPAPANVLNPQISTNTPYGHILPTMSGNSQVYNQPNPPTQQPYLNPPASIPLQQYGYQPSQNGLYPAGAYATPATSQQYACKDQTQYGQQHMGGYSQQNHPVFQGGSPSQGQPQQYPPYQGPSLIQTGYSQPPIPYQQHENRSHGQLLLNRSIYNISAYETGHTQYQQGYHNQNRKSQNSRPPYQSRLGKHNYMHNASAQSSVSSFNKQGYGHSTVTPQQPNLFEGKQTSGISSAQHDVEISSSQTHELQNFDEEEDFAWDLEMSFVENNYKLADEIAHPLPSFHNEEIILPPTSDAKGITSKYVRPHNLEIFMRDIRLSLNWAVLKGDPVFKEIDYDLPLIPLEELKAWVGQQLGQINEESDTENNQEPNPITENGDQDLLLSEQPHWHDGQNDHPSYQTNFSSDLIRDTQQSPIRPSLQQQHQRASSDRSETPVLRQTSSTGRSGTPAFGTDDDVWAPQPGEGQTSTSPDEDPTEALLASLGVTGAPKPVSQKSSSSNLIVGPKDEYVQEFYAPRPCRQDSGYASQRGSYSAVDSATTYYDYGHSYDGKNPPPPPPPPPRPMRRQFDGANDSPPSDGSGRLQVVAGAALSNIHNGLPQCISPLTPTSAENATYENSFLNDSKKKPVLLRQVDDITPKLKRRQPKVADAYSRRW